MFHPQESLGIDRSGCRILYARRVLVLVCWGCVVPDCTRYTRRNASHVFRHPCLSPPGSPGVFLFLTLSTVVVNDLSLCGFRNTFVHYDFVYVRSPLVILGHCSAIAEISLWGVLVSLSGRFLKQCLLFYRNDNGREPLIHRIALISVKKKKERKRGKTNDLIGR